MAGSELIAVRPIAKVVDGPLDVVPGWAALRVQGRVTRDSLAHRLLEFSARCDDRRLGERRKPPLVVAQLLVDPAEQRADRKRLVRTSRGISRHQPIQLRVIDDTLRQFNVTAKLQLRRGHVSIGQTGTARDDRHVACLCVALRVAQVMCARVERSVVDIDSQIGNVEGVAGIREILDLTGELPDRAFRRKHQPHVGKNPEPVEAAQGAAVQRDELTSDVGATGAAFLEDGLPFVIHGTRCVRGTSAGLHPFKPRSNVRRRQQLLDAKLALVLVLCFFRIESGSRGGLPRLRLTWDARRHAVVVGLHQTCGETKLAEHRSLMRRDDRRI